MSKKEIYLLTFMIVAMLGVVVSVVMLGDEQEIPKPIVQKVEPKVESIEIVQEEKVEESINDTQEPLPILSIKKEYKEVTKIEPQKP